MDSTENKQPDTESTPVDGESYLAELGGVEIIYQPLPDSEIPQDIQKNLAPAADDGRRMVLARNLTPLPPRQMGLTLYCLMNDPNPAVRNAAEDSFDDLPPNLIRTLAAQDLPANMLDYLARNFHSENDDDQILETIVLNRATGVDTLLLLVRVSSPRILDLIGNNQVRLQQSPQLISEFPKNPRVTIAQLSRVLEFGRRQNLITIDQENLLIDQFLGKREPEKEPIKVEEVVKEVVTESGEVDWEFPSFLTADFEADMELDAEASAIEEKISSKVNLRDLVRTMSVPQKMRLAVRGNMEARKILIEDSLSLVAKQVLSSPRITKTEIERAAESRTVDAEVLELIAKDASATRNYAVRHALVTNPKTPLPIANKMMNTLMERDIKIISKSRAVPQAIQSIARQKIDAQEQRRKKRMKKKK